MKNIYTDKIKSILPRILSFYDSNCLSANFGSGDRMRWAWGLTDFSNSTYICSMFGLSCLVKSNFFSNKNKEILEKIDMMFCNINHIVKNKEGFSESFPNEHSYCVTALVADAAIGTLQNLENLLDKNVIAKYSHICSQVICSLDQLKEEHAFISNHLATASLAYARYWKLTGNLVYKKKSYSLIKRILKNQSKEGWYKEYDGFDPGYETLSINYLSQVFQITKFQRLKISIIKSCNFLDLFILSDNSFGGIYGSRCTEFFFPGGFEILNRHNIKFSYDKIRNGINSGSHANLLSMDDMNLIPMFNSYCLGLVNFNIKKNVKRKFYQINKYFKDSGIYIIKNKNYELIVNCKKGGCYNYLINKKLIQNYGVLIEYDKKYASTQKMDQKNIIKINNNEIQIKSFFKKSNYRAITPFEFILLRILCLSLFKFKFFREKFKILAVKKLISQNKKIKALNERKIFLYKDKIRCADKIFTKLNYKKIQTNQYFNHIHMASRGYWHTSK